ncbi:MAG: hypothetical protein ABFD08_07990 [Syntrophomonas sp.]
MILYVKNETQFKIDFCSGEKEYSLKPGDEIAIQVKDQDCMYFDKVEGGGSGE